MRADKLKQFKLFYGYYNDISRWNKIDPSYIPWLTKLAACGFGLLFLALAFLAEYLGGILQAALTIFGAVGGPLFGVFTLGMFTTYANQRVSFFKYFTYYFLVGWFVEMFPINNVVFILKIQSKTCFLHFYLFIGTLELHNIIAFCYVIFQGVSIGLLTGMAVTLWISFGGPRPVPVKLPLSADGCGFNVTQIPSVLIDPSYYPYPYRISYLWTSPVS